MVKAAKNFPKTISKSFKGDVINNSIVPSFCSSAINLIVSAGDRNIIKNTAPARKPLILASEKASDTDATKKKPVIVKKEAATIYAIGDFRYPINSLLKIVIIFFNLVLSEL